jgi:predicted Zn finger-like uncharacterized protein
MPIDVACPACGRKLRVPDDLVGKPVRCQNCNQQFTAAEEVENIEMEVVEGPPAAAQQSQEVPQATSQTKKLPSALEVIEEVEEVDESPERRRPRRKKRKRRGDAVQMVYLPGLLLTIAGYVGVGINALVILINLVGAVNALVSSAQAPRGSVGVNPLMILTAVGVQLFITALWGSAVIRGGQSFTSMNSYSMAIIGCIAACLPCSLGCFLGLPIGIWGLVVLMQDHVRRTFD